MLNCKNNLRKIKKKNIQPEAISYEKSLVKNLLGKMFLIDTSKGTRFIYGKQTMRATRPWITQQIFFFDVVTRITIVKVFLQFNGLTDVFFLNVLELVTFLQYQRFFFILFVKMHMQNVLSHKC